MLDACCGLGSSALPAAHAVGPTGTVDALDVATGLLERGRRAARAQDLANIRFVTADVTSWRPAVAYDVVMCVLGVFLLPDMDRDAGHLVSLVRPGGRFGVTVWAKGALEDFGRALYEVVSAHRPDLADQGAAGAPIERINTGPLLRDWLDSLALRDVRLHHVPRRVSLTPHGAWSLVLGSGFRGLLSGLSEPVTETIRTELLTLLARRRIDSLDASILTGIGRR